MENPLSAQVVGQTPSVCLRVTSKGITTIDIVPLEFTGISSLFISSNCISKLKNISQFPRLLRLMVESNEIATLEDLKPLAKLPVLEDLRLGGNPVCRLPFWKYHVLRLCPNLKWLNGKRVNIKDAMMVVFEEKLLKLILDVEFARDMINKDGATAQTIAKRISKLNANGFMKEVREGCEEPKAYFSYLKSRGLSAYMSVSDLLPKCDAEEHFKEKFYRMRRMLEEAVDLERLTEVMEPAAATALNLIGIGPKPNVTRSVQIKGEGNPFVEQAVNIALKYMNTDDDSEVLRRSKLLWPTEDLSPRSAKLNRRALARRLASSLTSPDTFEFMKRKRLADAIRDQLKSNDFRTDLIVDPLSLVATHRDEHNSDDELARFRRNSSSSDDDHDGHSRGLTFDAQVKLELSDRRHSFSEYSFNSDSSRSYARSLSTPRDDQTSEPSSVFSAEERPRRPNARRTAKKDASPREQEVENMVNQRITSCYFERWKRRLEQPKRKHRRKTDETIWSRGHLSSSASAVAFIASNPLMSMFMGPPKRSTESDDMDPTPIQKARSFRGRPPNLPVSPKKPT